MDFESGIFSFGGTQAALPDSAEMRQCAAASDKTRVAMIGTYPPRQCGVATFTCDTVEQTQAFHPEIDFQVYALANPSDGCEYPDDVHVLPAQEPTAYRAAAEAINDSGADAVWIQHEYGIFGGPDGEMVCDFVDRLAPPLILTLHTVLPDPSERQRAILEHLLSRASRVMVMSRHGRALLCADYGAPGDMVEVIEHGAPDRPFGGTAGAKAALGLEDRPVAMTFGLIGPGKGLEHVIDALPGILVHHPDFIYRIVGATHPNLVARDGESYREMLIARAQALGVDHAIQWENRYLDTEVLLDRLSACDIFVTPYPNMQQSTSGTLSYAVALGKAVIATPYIHARELLADDVGMLVAPNSATALAEAIITLLDDPDALSAMQKRAWERGRETIWPRYADAATGLIRSAAVDPSERAPLTVVPSLEGVFAMSDATGMLQHAIGTVPDRRHGYCLDDNVRALMLMNVAEGIEAGERARRATCYASFVQHAWNPDERAFRNFMRFDREWCEDTGSEDSNGRTLWTLGQTMELSRDPDLRAWARQCYDTALPHLRKLASPRARAFVMLGTAARLRREPDHDLSREVLAEGAEFLSFRLSETRGAHWPWFENRLGYDNPRLSQALIEAGTILDEAGWRQDGLETARWLASIQTSANGLFRPVGSNSLGRDREILPFDQQPLEAQAAIEAARAAFIVDGDPAWIAHARAAWRWFFGANDRGVVLADLATGRCRDGVNPRGRNENCGAESILALHLARHSMLALDADNAGDSAGELRGRHQQPGFRVPANPVSDI